MMTTIFFDLDGLPPSGNKRLHYMARHASNQSWKSSAALVARDALNRVGVRDAPWMRAHVEYAFHYPKVTRVDLDNLIASMKPVLDGLVGIAVVDDDARHVHRIGASVSVDKSRPSGFRVSVTKCDCL